MVCELTYQLGNAADPDGRSATTVDPILDKRLVRHSGYSGDLQIAETPPPPVFKDAAQHVRRLPEPDAPAFRPNRADRRRRAES
jgi:hypothetical protein